VDCNEQTPATSFILRFQKTRKQKPHTTRRVTLHRATTGREKKRRSNATHNVTVAIALTDCSGDLARKQSHIQHTTHSTIIVDSNSPSSPSSLIHPSTRCPVASTHTQRSLGDPNGCFHAKKQLFDCTQAQRQNEDHTYHFGKRLSPLLTRQQQKAASPSLSIA